MSDHGPNERTDDQPNDGANATVRTYLTYAAAGSLLGLTSDAVRMKCRRRTLVCETVDGQRMVVWPQPEQANERRTPNGDRDRRERESVRPDAAAQRVALLEAQLARAERERDDWQTAYRDQSDRLDGALALAATAQRLAEQERSRADMLAATVDRLRSLPERANERTPTATVANADGVRDGATGEGAALSRRRRHPLNPLRISDALTRRG